LPTILIPVCSPWAGHPNNLPAHGIHRQMIFGLATGSTNATVGFYVLAM
jgi:D-hexose-6-phosphate mutarotase